MSRYKNPDDESKCLIFIPGKLSHYVIGDTIFGDLGWAWASMAGVNGGEYIFAYGWHESGVAIEALRKVSGNHLCGWSEAQITLYEQWYPPLDEQATFCWKTFSTSATPSHDNPLSIRPQKVTIFRHEGWSAGSDLKRHCARLKGWYKGCRKHPIQEPSSLMLQPYDLHHLPGYLLYGYLDGARQRLLEWPTHDYAWLKGRASMWRSRGAVNLELCKSGLVLFADDSGWIDQRTDTLITCAIEHYGDDFNVMDVLRFGY